MIYFTACILVIGSFLLFPGLTIGESDQVTQGNLLLAQPLIREGDLAVRLVETFNLGEVVTEAEAESLLISIDIAPGNGWIADYPVTPDIVGELQTAISEAAESGKLAVSEDVALQTLQNILSDYDLSATADTSQTDTGEASPPDYPDSAGARNYYYDEGPPVVTYYAPPPDYAYLYTWVSYPFWWRGSRFPGFFVEKKFHVWVHGPERGHGQYVSNYFQDSKSNKIFRIDPANRSKGGTVADGGGVRRPVSPTPTEAAASGESHARSIIRTQGEFRGYGASGSSIGTRSNVFERSVNSNFERNASDRGFQSRSIAGQISGKGNSVGSSRDGAARGGGSAGGFHGGGGGSAAGARH